MAGTRSYGDACGIARAFDVIGERWAPLIVRELLLGPKRFTDIQVGLPKASPNVLSQRLRELEQAGVVRRRRLPPPAASQVYELTDWGQDLEPAFAALGRWGSRSPAPRSETPLSVDALVVAMRTMCGPSPDPELNAMVELRLGRDVFRARVSSGRLHLSRGPCDRPDAVLETEPVTLQGMLFHGHPLDDALARGDARMQGDIDKVRALLALFG